MKKFHARGLASVLFFALVMLVSGCAATPSADDNAQNQSQSQAQAQSRNSCETHVQTGSRMGRRVCRDSDNGSSDD